MMVGGGAKGANVGLKTPIMILYVFNYLRPNKIV